MEAMMRRCLDCDRTFAMTGQCPHCGSAKTLIIHHDLDDGHGFAHSGSWLLIIHALLITAITGQEPGLLIGSLLFAGGLCGFLILLAVEDALRVARSVTALAMILHLLYALSTGQTLLFLPSALLLLIVILLLHHDTGAIWLPSMRRAGWTVAILLSGIALFATYRGPLPGWWQGIHLPWQALAPQAVPEDLKPHPGLPTSERP